uniref:PDZ domain-containing protein n=1 Tax=Ditylenchus dipsaci TaxID=166011 RepID=A0A915DZZ1_9BILA
MKEFMRDQSEGVLAGAVDASNPPASPKNLSSSDGNDCKTNAASSTSPQPIDTKNQQDSDQQLQPTTTTISSTVRRTNSHANPPCCNNGGYARSRLFRGPSEALLPSAEDCYDGSVGSCGSGAALGGQGSSWPATNNCQQQLFSVTLHRAHPNGFGIAISGGCDNPHFVSGDPSIVVSDVIASGPAFGLVQINDRIVSANGLCLENAEYAMAVAVMKDAEQLNMIVKRRVPVPFVEFEQRTLKFTLSKSRKKTVS